MDFFNKLERNQIYNRQNTHLCKLLGIYENLGVIKKATLNLICGIKDMIHRKKAGAVQGLEREVQLHLKRFRELEADIAAYLLDTLEHS